MRVRLVRFSGVRTMFHVEHFVQVIMYVRRRTYSGRRMCPLVTNFAFGVGASY
jgi:hypothetical protein